MYLRRIALQRFKCFESVDIECSKFTLLTGANSSGKSSIIYGLLGALQTTNFPFYFSPNGSYVNMGDFAELALNHRKRSTIAIKLDLAEEETGRLLTFDGTFAQNAATKLPKLNCLNFKSAFLDLSIRKNGKFITEFQYRPDQDETNLKRTPGFQKALQRFFTDMSVIASETSKKRGKRKQASPASVKEFMQEFFVEETQDKFTFGGSVDVFRHLIGRPSLAPHIRQITIPIIQYERLFNYVSSFRLPPERTYYQRTKAALKVEKFGENWVEQVVEWEQSKSRQLEKLKQAARKLKLLEDVR